MRSGNTLSIPLSVRYVVQQDGAVLLDVESGLMFSVNPVGGLIWDKLGEGVRPEEIAVFLSSRFEIALDRSEEDVQEFISNLIQHRLLRENGQ